MSDVRVEQPATSADAIARTAPGPTKAVHSWSLFREMGRYVAPGSMPSGAMPEVAEPNGLALLDLPRALADHGFRSVQLCHFYLPTRDPGYLAELRSAFDESGVALECFLIDDGDLTAPTAGEEQEAWISGWLTAAEQLRAPRARVVAGKRAPTVELLATSARRLSSLADRHAGTRIVTENWHALLPDAASVNELLDRADGRVGFLVDLGNWSGPDKYTQLAQVASRAETCQAKCRTDAEGNLEADDYRASLQVLRDAEYAGPLALVYDGGDPHEWAKLEEEYALVCDVFASSAAAG